MRNWNSIKSIPSKRLKRWIVLGILLMPVFTYAFMKVLWLTTPRKTINISIVDKSVVSTDGLEHSAFFWVLKQQGYVKSDRSLYNANKDYWGFFPLGNETFRVDDFQNKTDDQLDSLAAKTDMVYYTDTYGIYASAWYKGKNRDKQPQLVYGGMDDNDIQYLQNMKKKGKLIIAEFNVIEPPTKTHVRRAFEKEFGIEWTGWTGRYFESLDPMNEKVPGWLVPTYDSQHNTQWTFKGAGIVFVNEDGRVEVLTEGADLDNALPVIHTFSYGIEHLGMEETVEYPHWFDVVLYNDSINHAVSAYELQVNKHGRAELDRLGIPVRIPSVIMHNEDDYRFFYFCGDYCSKPIPYSTSSFNGIQNFSWMISDKDNKKGGDVFFYNFYFPMISKIMNDYYHKKS